MTLAEDSAGADTSGSRRGAPRPAPARRSPRWRWGLAAPLVASLLVVLMQWPGSAQGTTTTASATTSSTVAPPSTQAPTTAAPTTTAPPSSDPSTTGGVVTSELTPAATPGPSPVDKAKLDAAAASKASQIDAANAKLEDLSLALATLNKKVTAQSARVDYANQQLGAAVEKVRASDQAVSEAEAGLSVLELRMRGQAIRNFMGDDVGQAAVIVTGDPNQSIRMQTMLAEVTQSGIDLSATLQSAKEDLEVQRAEAMNAREEAEALRQDATGQLGILQGDRDAQSKLASSGESRLNHLLSERQALGALGANIDTSDPTVSDLVRQLQASSAGRPVPPQDVPVPATVSESEIALAGNGIRVLSSIVGSVKRLLGDASAAGFELGGGGYRDPAGQIAVRKSNCGTSNYAIYQMPASSCRPPTAIPGQSMHERGLAIDFTSNGDLVKSHSSAAWIWLNQHAAAYGLYNLPSEPWHWSTTGQ